MAVKKLVVVVDSTAAMESYWNTILEGYLKKIIRHFCRNESIGQDASGTVAELGLVQYQLHGLTDGELSTQPASWTRDMNTFLQWLSDLKFDGNYPDSSGIAKGLADALMMFQTHPSGVQEQRHCILVASSNPFNFVDMPLTGNPRHEISILGTKIKTTDVVSIAKLYIQLMVSLSVISPRQLPILRKIYNAANLSSNAMDPFFNNVKNSDFLVLLSEKFFEAHVALCENEITDQDLDLSEEDILLLERVLNQPSTNQISIAEGSISNKVIEGEVKTAPFTKLQADMEKLPHVTPFVPPWIHPHHFSKTIPCLQTYNRDDFASQEMIFGNTNAPRAIVLSQKARPLIPTIVNPSIIISHKAQTFKEAASVVNTGEILREDPKIFSKYQRNHEARRPPVLDLEPKIRTPTYLQDQISDLLFFTINPNIARTLMGMEPIGVRTAGKRNQGSLQSLVPPIVPSNAFIVPSMRVQSIFENSITSTAYNPKGSLKIPMGVDFQTMHTVKQSPRGIMSLARDKLNAFPGSPDLAENINTGLRATRCNVSGNLNVTQDYTTFQSPIGLDYLLPQGGHGYLPRTQMQQEEDRYKWDAMSSCGQSSPSALAEMHPQEDEGMESTISVDALDNNFHGHDRYFKAWEGAISALMDGHLMTITRAMAYRPTSTSHQITSDWPKTLQLGRLLCQDFFEKFPKLDPKYYLIIEVVNNHSILEHLRTRKLCSNVKLPSQTMIFSPTKKECYFIATVFPGDYPIYRSKVPNLTQGHLPQKKQQGERKNKK